MKISHSKMRTPRHIRIMGAEETRMRLEDRNLSIEMNGENVRLLHNELRQLGFAIPDAEFRSQSFGELTQRAVREFQKQRDLPPTGVVDQHTADLINAATAALPPQPPGPIAASFVVQGKVRGSNGNSVAS